MVVRVGGVVRVGIVCVSSTIQYLNCVYRIFRGWSLS